MSNIFNVFLVFVAIVGSVYFFRGMLTPSAQAEEPKDFPPKPKWKPNIPVNIERVEKTANYYTDGKKTFAIFKNGTVVFVDSAARDLETQAKARLNDIFMEHPDFNAQSMDDGNYIVSYSQPAYSVVFKDEFENNLAYIEANHLDGLCRAEVLLDKEGHPNKFDERGKIGLFGRARMFMDAQDPVVIKIHHGSGDNHSRDADAKK